MRLLATLLALTAVVPAAEAAPVPAPAAKSPAEQVVGTWRLVKTSKKAEVESALVVEFGKDGTMTLRQTTGDDPAVVLKGTYKVDGTKLPYEYKIGDGTHAETLTIKKVSDKELVVVDPDGVVEEFEREKVAEKK